MGEDDAKKKELKRSNLPGASKVIPVDTDTAAVVAAVATSVAAAASAHPSNPDGVPVGVFTAADLQLILTARGARIPKYPMHLDLSSSSYNIVDSSFLTDAPDVLKDLNLADHAIEVMPRANLPQLKRLNMSNNRLRSCNLAHGIGPGLVQLTFSHNKISTLCGFASATKLVALYLDHNSIRAGFSELRFLASLQLLDVSHNDISMTMAQFYRHFIVNLSSLHRLSYVSFAGNPLASSIEYFRHFLISELPQVKFIDYEPVTSKERKRAKQLATLNVFAAKNAKTGAALEDVTQTDADASGDTTSTAITNVNTFREVTERIIRSRSLRTPRNRPMSISPDACLSPTHSSTTNTVAFSTSSSTRVPPSSALSTSISDLTVVAAPPALSSGPSSPRKSNPDLPSSTVSSLFSMQQMLNKGNVSGFVRARSLRHAKRQEDTLNRLSTSASVGADAATFHERLTSPVDSKLSMESSADDGVDRRESDMSTASSSATPSGNLRQRSGGSSFRLRNSIRRSFKRPAVSRSSVENAHSTLSDSNPSNVISLSTSSVSSASGDGRHPRAPIAAASSTTAGSSTLGTKEETPTSEMFGMIPSYGTPLGAGVDIDFDELFLGSDLLGYGRFGDVRKAVLLDEPVSVKSIPIVRGTVWSSLRRIQQDLSTLNMLAHRNIVTFIGLSQQGDTIYIVSEFLAGGSLFELLHRDRAVQAVDLIKIALDIAEGLRYLHDLTPPIAHGFLKSMNVLLDTFDEGAITAKISDVRLEGIWCSVCNENPLDMHDVSPHWSAPEVLRGEPSEPSADVYALGIIMWEMFSRRLPFSQLRPSDIVVAVCDLNERPQFPPSFPNYLRRLVTVCWSPKASARPNLKQVQYVLHHPLDMLLDGFETDVAGRVSRPVERMPSTDDRSRSWLAERSLMHTKEDRARLSERAAAAARDIPEDAEIDFSPPTSPDSAQRSAERRLRKLQRLKATEAPTQDEIISLLATQLDTTTSDQAGSTSTSSPSTSTSAAAISSLPGGVSPNSGASSLNVAPNTNSGNVQSSVVICTTPPSTTSSVVNLTATSPSPSPFSSSPTLGRVQKGMNISLSTAKSVGSGQRTGSIRTARVNRVVVTGNNGGVSGATTTTPAAAAAAAGGGGGGGGNAFNESKTSLGTTSPRTTRVGSNSSTEDMDVNSSDYNLSMARRGNKPTMVKTPPSSPHASSVFNESLMSKSSTQLSTPSVPSNRIARLSQPSLSTAAKESSLGPRVASSIRRLSVRFRRIRASSDPPPIDDVEQANATEAARVNVLKSKTSSGSAAVRLDEMASEVPQLRTNTVMSLTLNALQDTDAQSRRVAAERLSQLVIDTSSIQSLIAIDGLAVLARVIVAPQNRKDVNVLLPCLQVVHEIGAVALQAMHTDGMHATLSSVTDAAESCIRNGILTGIVPALQLDHDPCVVAALDAATSLIQASPRLGGSRALHHGLLGVTSLILGGLSNESIQRQMSEDVKRQQQLALRQSGEAPRLHGDSARAAAAALLSAVCQVENVERQECIVLMCSHGVVAALVDLIACSSEGHVRVRAVETLARILCLGDETSHRLCIETGGADVLVDMMQSNLAAAQRHSLLAINALLNGTSSASAPSMAARAATGTTSKHHDALVFAGVIPPTLRLLDSGDRQVRRLAADVTYSICVSARSCRALAALDGIPILVSCVLEDIDSPALPSRIIAFRPGSSREAATAETDAERRGSAWFALELVCEHVENAREMLLSGGGDSLLADLEASLERATPSSSQPSKQASVTSSVDDFVPVNVRAVSRSSTCLPSSQLPRVGNDKDKEEVNAKVDNEEEEAKVEVKVEEKAKVEDKPTLKLGSTPRLYSTDV